MKRSSFLKSVLALAAAPLAIVKVKGQPAQLIPSRINLQLDRNLYNWAVCKCGDYGKAADFATWYHQTLRYWLRELKKDPYFHQNKSKSVELARFEGQTFENLWKLFQSEK